MGVQIESITFANEFRPETTNWLLGNIFNKIVATIDYRVSTTAISSTAIPITLNNKDGYIGVGWATCSSPVFAEFQVGDTVNMYNYVTGVFQQALTVVEKLSDSEVRFNAAIVTSFPSTYADDFDTVQNAFYVTVPVTAARFKYNLIENSEATSYLSKVDGSLQELRADTVDATDTVTVLGMEFQGAKSYQIGGATIKGRGVVNDATGYLSKFRIVHTFYITPFFLADQWEDLILNIKPDYFTNGNTLKYVYEVIGMREATNPNQVQFIVRDEVAGNTGWFNENFNNNPSKYFIDSVVYKRPDASVINALELTTDETTVDVTVKSSVTPFSSGNTKFVLNFIKAPEDATEYQANGETQDFNFFFDRKLQTLGDSAVNGEQFGNPERQVFKDITSTVVSSSEIVISFKVALGADLVDFLSALDAKRYILSVAIQNHSLTTPNSDLVTLKIDSREFYEDFSDDGMIVISNKLLSHYENDLIRDGATTAATFPEDEMVAHSLIYIDTDKREDDVILLKEIAAMVVATNGNGDEFVLDKFALNLSGLPLIGGWQYVDFEQSRGYNIPPTDIRSKIKIKRRADLDDKGFIGYQLIFPFFMRWEYWRPLVNVNSDFFNTAEPNNGFNHKWLRYGNIEDWSISYKTRVLATKNGKSLRFQEVSSIIITDYDTSPVWEPDSIKAFDNATDEELISGSTKFITGYNDTRIEARFEKSSAFDIDRIVVNMGVEVYEEGGVTGRHRISSEYDVMSSSWFKSIGLSNRVTLNLLDNNIIVAKALINYANLPTGKQKFKITARLYEKPAPPTE